MYNIGEKVVYGSEGTCIIEGIEERDYGQECKEYYKLTPLYHQQSTIYVPVQNEIKGRLRKTMSRGTLEDMIQQTLITPTEWIVDNKRRQQYSVELLKSGDVLGILKMMKAMVLYNQGKMLNSRDKDTLQKAQRLVFSEMAAAYEKDYDEIVQDMANRFQTVTE